MMVILDRLLHHGEVFYLRGASYRMRGKEAVVLGAAAPSTTAGAAAAAPDGNGGQGERTGT